jgi:cyanate lyase
VRRCTGTTHVACKATARSRRSTHTSLLDWLFRRVPARTAGVARLMQSVSLDSTETGGGQMKSVAAKNTPATMKRQEVSDLIAFRRVTKGIKWSEVAKKVGQSKEWVTAACLGQMQMTAKQAGVVGKMFDLPEAAVQLLQTVPYKGSLPTAVPTDPLIYRWYEIVNVYGTTIKELIHEEFGDGIMSAIDFDMTLEREPDQKGDRVKITMSGKFLPYRRY